MGIARSSAKKLYIAFRERLAQRKHLYVTECLIYKPTQWKFGLHIRDFNRLASLQLAADEISRRNVAGEVAEVGVYRGEFAAHINRMFPNKSLYLFDTFGGFDDRDLEEDQKRKLYTGNQDWSDTSTAVVLAKMPHPEKCIVRKGYFPQTASGVEETFAFVSLDTDLYQPIYDGLAYFFPRLNHGGFIFVHDFNNDLYPGAKEAVVAFCDEFQIGYSVLPDGGGTAVISR